ncbi:MAG TPA: hypothetical protein VHQ22_01805 [Terriglobales bacterium]|nr:hypothetical protein [Terriglobales bacterium]
MPFKNRNLKTDPTKIDPAFQPVVDAFRKHRDVTGGKMMSSYGLKVNGKIFAMFGRKQFVAKLPKDRVDELVSAGSGKRFDPGHGRLMKEWFVAGDGAPGWLELAKEAYDFVRRGSA